VAKSDIRIHSALKNVQLKKTFSLVDVMLHDPLKLRQGKKYHLELAFFIINLTIFGCCFYNTDFLKLFNRVFFAIYV